MSLSLTDSPKFAITRTGMDIRDDLSFEEWAALAPKLNEASRCVAFAIGDWLVYGQHRFNKSTAAPAPKVKGSAYEVALAATGLDLTTLHAYAYVSRNVPAVRRNEALSWEHHKTVAKLEEHEQQQWLGLVDEQLRKGEAVSTRRLRKSILVGRLVTPAEMCLDPADRRIENHIPFVNRLVSWWSRMRAKRWLDQANKDQRAALKRDLTPIVEIWRQL